MPEPLIRTLERDGPATISLRDLERVAAALALPVDHLLLGESERPEEAATTDLARIGAALLAMAPAEVARDDLARALDWTLARVEAAVDSLDRSLWPLGLAVARHADRRYTIIAVRTAALGANVDRVRAAARYRRSYSHGELDVICDVRATGWPSHTRDPEAIRTLRVEGVLVAADDGFVLAAEIVYSLQPLNRQT